MLQKYTKFCNAETLIKIIQSSEKDEQSMHILLSVFKKSLAWVEEKFKREGLLDAIQKITVKRGLVDQKLAWLFVIKEGFSYYQMPFHMSEYITFTDWTPKYLNFSKEGVFAVITQENVNELQQLANLREIQSIKKFVKANLFYPYYLQEQHIQQFISLIRIKPLKYGQKLHWKDEDGSHKIGVIYRGLLSLEYQWKRKIEIVQLTKGKYITNSYIKDQLEQIEDYQRETVESIREPTPQLPKFRYVSKSDDTILLIFNFRLINQPPYNVNHEIVPMIKENYEKYSQKLQKIIGFAQTSKLYRNKSSIKEKIKKNQIHQTVKRNISLHLSKANAITSPVVKTFATIEAQTSPFETSRTIDLPEPIKAFSKVVFSSISPKSNTKFYRSKTIEVQSNLSSRRVIHNTWLQQLGKKKVNIKSFSTLQTLTTYNPHKIAKQQQLKKQMQKDQKPQFFVPDQFVKRKLRLKYQNLVKKVRDMDLTIKKQQSENITDKMHKLEEYIESKRIVKLNNVKRKFHLLRDKVLY